MMSELGGSDKLTGMPTKASMSFVTNGEPSISNVDTVGTVPGNGYKIRLLEFPEGDERRETSDGAVFEIEPHESSTVMRLVEPGYVASRCAVKGSGWYLGISPEGELERYKIGPGLEENPEFTLREGAVDVLIAGEEGLEVADFSTPHFKPHMEKEVVEDQGYEQTAASEETFREFWQLYHDLKAGNIPEDLR